MVTARAAGTGAERRSVGRSGSCLWLLLAERSTHPRSPSSEGMDHGATPRSSGSSLTALADCFFARLPTDSPLAGGVVDLGGADRYGAVRVRRAALERGPLSDPDCLPVPRHADA